MDPQHDNEIVLRGTAAAPGIAVGPAYVYSKQTPRVEHRPVAPEDLDAEIERLRTAVARSEKELTKIQSFAEQKLGAQSARIFEAQIMILGDAILMRTIEGRIRKELRNAESLVHDEISKYKRLMLAAPDEYMHERAHDVDDVMNRIIRNVQDQKLVSRLEGESIVVSEALAPADTVILSRNPILGYATDFGGVTSHAAILSRSLKIPAVVGLRTATRSIVTGDTLAIDGYAGVLTINPNEQTLDALRQKAQRLREFEEKLVGLAGLPAETPDHRRVELVANIDLVDEIEFAHSQGAGGIGLYRTEGQIIGKGAYPDEEQQFQEYKAVADLVFPHPVVFRAFDVGGDKIDPDGEHEANPFLGWRGIRVLLDRPELFLGQLRAFLMASVRKNVRIMFPMIATLQELRVAREYVRKAKAELKTRAIPFDNRVPVGVMVEVPSAAVLADELAREADFLSIGTNDLIQYLLAVDRDNNAVAGLYQPFNPAVLRTIKGIIDAGRRHHKPVGMCGEMAGDPVATILLLGMGLDHFSVVPTMLPEIKKIIRSVSLKEARRVAEKALAMESSDEVRDYLVGVLRQRLPEIPLD